MAQPARKLAVHITHESARKIGGIGAVLNGLCSTYSYKNEFTDTLLYGPYFQFTPDILPHFGKEGRVLYSSRDHYDLQNYTDVFGQIVRDYQVDIVYGKRTLTSDFDANKQNTVDVINVNINRINPHAVTRFKYKLWQNFQLSSDQLERDWDYEQYLRIAVPYLEILTALYGADCDISHFAHEYMGMPCAMSVLMAGTKEKTYFVAHEVSPVRGVVESHPGCDISFYNIMKKRPPELSFEQVFGSQHTNPRSELVKRANLCTRIFAVSDLVRDEYLFLSPQTDPDKVRVVYNGLSARGITEQYKEQSRSRLEDYTERLFNFHPDIIFTHVARLVLSKGLWRDITMLSCLDELFDAANLKGVYILVASLIATGRPNADTAQMEREYGWPVLHKTGWPDLTGAEEDIYNQLTLFNSRSKAIKGVFINQFGFDRNSCGIRVPADTEFGDLRIASDAELGFSIYEPFGIAQLETVPFGGVALLSAACGCAGHCQKTFADAPIKPFKVIDFAAAAANLSLKELTQMTAAQRLEIEREIINGHAQEIFELLPLTQKSRLDYLDNALAFAPHLGWEDTTRNYFLPNL